MILSPHFTLEEMVRSDYALRHGLVNVPGPKEVANLKRLADRLELIRAYLSQKAGREIGIRVSSGFRAPAVNKGVGGSPSSEHIAGRAADFTAPDFGPPVEVAKAIRQSGIPFNQLIYEFGTWVHVSIADVQAKDRREVLSIFNPGNYLNGIYLDPVRVA
jgi:hypothetical protein